MKVGKSVTKAIDEWRAGDSESAMLHACNAVDGTARKQGFASKGNRFRFTTLLRANYSVLGPMGAPGVNLAETLFPIRVEENGTQTLLDMADLIYSVHRCSHGHGDDLPEGFSLIPDAGSTEQITRMLIGQGKVQLSDRMIFALLAVAVTNNRNIDERAGDGYYLTFGASEPLFINDYWGKANEFLAILATVQLPQVKLELGEFPVSFTAR